MCSAQADNAHFDKARYGARSVDASQLARTLGFRQVVDAHAQEEFGDEEPSVPEPPHRRTDPRKSRNQGPRWRK